MNFERFRPGRRAAWLLLIPLLLACNFVSDMLSPAESLSPAATTPEATPISTATAPPPTATPPAAPTESTLPADPPPTPLVIPSPTSESPRMTDEPTLLPAALYFIGQTGIGQVGQIMRLEADGRSLSQITDAPEGILDFDVSAVDGRLVYVSDNQLIETGADGQNPIVKVDAGPIVDAGPGAGTGAARITQAIDRPRFSPDGGQIVFGLNGVNLILAGLATEYAILLPSDPFPDFNDPNFTMPEGPTRFYWPESWSPDGRRLLLRFGYYPEGGGLALLDLSSRELNMVTNADGIECCDWAWSADSQTGFVASDQIAYGVPGLIQVDPATGGSATLINGAPETPGVTGQPPSIRLFRAPFAAGNGIVYSFVATGDQDEPHQPLFHMAQLPAGANDTIPLRDDEYLSIDTLWAADGRGAVIADVGPSSTYPISGPIRWLAAGGEPAVDLPASGGMLRWGPP